MDLQSGPYNVYDFFGLINKNAKVSFTPNLSFFYKMNK